MPRVARLPGAVVLPLVLALLLMQGAIGLADPPETELAADRSAGSLLGGHDAPGDSSRAGPGLMSPTTAPDARIAPPTVTNRKGDVTEITPPTRPGVYLHTGKFFELHYPRQWQLLRRLHESDVSCVLTPEVGQTDFDKLQVAMQVELLPLDDSSAAWGQDPISLLKRLGPAIRVSQPGLKPVGEIAKATLGKLGAAKGAYRGSLEETPGDFRIDAYIARGESTIFLVSWRAPADRYDQVRPVMEKVLADSSFGQPLPPRLERSLEARDIVKRYKASVVSVVADGPDGAGTGTGFIISRDGYILTNCHVVYDLEHGHPQKTFYVEWDESLKKHREYARLVDYRFELSPYAESQHGVDIALLKIDAGDYEPMPLTPISCVEAGDGVVTMGFPSRSLMPGVSITITRGVVTRFNRGPDGRLVSFLTDAAITHGNSGGPCVSLVTGGVVGLNTWLPQPHKFANQQTTDLMNYFGVVPVEMCIQEWPLVTTLGIAPDGGRLDFLDSYGLSRLYLNCGSHSTARRLAVRATRLKPDSADAFCQLANCLVMQLSKNVKDMEPKAIQEDKDNIVRILQRALQCNTRHQESLVVLANLHRSFGELDEAAKYADRAIAADPRDVMSQYVRAQVAYDRKDYRLALKHLDKAKEVVGDLSPEPYMLAGDIYFDTGDPVAGKKQYEQAAVIMPSNLDARMGTGRYYEMKKDPDAAVAAYKSVLDDFPDNPVVLGTIGNCLFAVKRYAEALPYFDKGFVRYGVMNTPPDERLIMQFGQAATEVGKPDLAALMYSNYLSYYPTGSRSAEANVDLARLWATVGRDAVASAHLAWARELGGAEGLDALAAKVDAKSPKLTVDDIKIVVSEKYPLGVTCSLVEHSQLDPSVKADTDDEIVALLKTQGLPVEVVRAIIKTRKAARTSSKPAPAQHVGTDQAPPPLPPLPPPPLPAMPGADVNGLWMAKGAETDGSAWQLWLQLSADGHYALHSYKGNQLVMSVQGTFQVKGDQILGKAENDRAWVYTFKRSGNTLTLHISDQDGDIQFDRQGD
ncbi:MAG: hypothetical protein BIFFINMI_00293 [Phycisphaerae bacterium]|nr:hypothetical protein [Phycisphaerae bacterium]